MYAFAAPAAAGAWAVEIIAGVREGGVVTGTYPWAEPLGLEIGGIRVAVRPPPSRPLGDPPS